MGYPQKLGAGFFVRKSNALDTAENLAAAAAVYGGYLVTKACAVQELRFYVTTAILAGTTAPVIEVNRRPTYNSASGELQIASMTIPTGTAAGKVVAKKVAPYQLVAGDELSFEHVTQAADPGTAAGAGFYDVVVSVDDESDANQSNLVVV